LTSLRTRLLVGAVLWTLGSGAITHILGLALGSRYPRMLVLHTSLMSMTAVLLLLAGVSYVRGGMSPLDKLRARLWALRAGEESRLEGNYPAEVQPLVNDLNALLEDRESSVVRAQAKAGDLAHGLQTPLAVLSQEAERVGAAGHAELAATIQQQVERMRRHVNYHLAHARAAASRSTLGARSSVAETVQGLVRTLLRLHAERGLTLDVDIPSDHTVRCEREDVEEMLGNLLDNACKWARSRLRVSSELIDSRVVIHVDDDGPGLDPSLREAVLQRGVRADEAAPGSGFGLAIVRELAELYGGKVILTVSPEGGVRARLNLPAA